MSGRNFRSGPVRRPAGPKREGPVVRPDLNFGGPVVPYQFCSYVGGEGAHYEEDDESGPAGALEREKKISTNIII